MNTRVSRRDFLNTFSYGIACMATLSPATVFAVLNEADKNSQDALSFVDMDGLGPPVNSMPINKKFKALHAERRIPLHEIDSGSHQYAEQLLRKLVDDMGMAWDEQDRLIWTYQHYGFYDYTFQCQQLRKYCQSVQAFLYGSVQGMPDKNIQWHTLSSDFDYSKPGKARFTGIVGRYNYQVSRVNLVDTDGNVKDPGLVRAVPVNRAINYISSKNESKTSLIYIIPGDTSLVSPFSELLHIVTHAPSLALAKKLELKYSLDVAKRVSLIMGETITETAAILMAEKYIEKYNHRGRMNVVDTHAASLANQYALFSETIDFMKHHGVQDTLQIFQDDPLLLTNKISYSLSRINLPHY